MRCRANAVRLPVASSRNRSDSPAARPASAGAVAVRPAVAPGGLDGEARLAGAAGTEDGDKPPGGEQRVDAGEVVLPADEAGQRRGQVAPLLPLDGVGGGRRPLGPQQAQMALAQGGARVGAEGVGQGFAKPLLPGEGLGLTSLGGERVHEQGGGPFLDGPLGEQGGQTGGGGVGAAQGQLGLGEVGLGEVGDGEVGDGLDRDMGQPDRGGGAPPGR